MRRSISPTTRGSGWPRRRSCISSQGYICRGQLSGSQRRQGARQYSWLARLPRVPNLVVNAEPYGSLNLPGDEHIDRADKKFNLRNKPLVRGEVQHLQPAERQHYPGMAGAVRPQFKLSSILSARYAAVTYVHVLMWNTGHRAGRSSSSFELWPAPRDEERPLLTAPI